MTMQRFTLPALMLALAIGVGLTLLGFQLGSSVVRFKQLDRVVTVKGLAEREVAADIALWPITFIKPHNELDALYRELARDSATVENFLKSAGLTDDEIIINPPNVTDKLADSYGNNGALDYRYTATQTLMVNTTQIDKVLQAKRQLAVLGREGIVLRGENYGETTEFIFSGLNAIKPAMIEEATRNAREVAEKFAADSDSRLGKIRTATQGQFSIDSRDQQTPQIKKVRVVSTLEYYLVD